MLAPPSLSCGDPEDIYDKCFHFQVLGGVCLKPTESLYQESVLYQEFCPVFCPFSSVVLLRIPQKCSGLTNSVSSHSITRFSLIPVFSKTLKRIALFLAHLIFLYILRSSQACLCIYLNNCLAIRMAYNNSLNPIIFVNIELLTSVKSVN